VHSLLSPLALSAAGQAVGFAQRVAQPAGNAFAAAFSRALAEQEPAASASAPQFAGHRSSDLAALVDAAARLQEVVREGLQHLVADDLSLAAGTIELRFDEDQRRVEVTLDGVEIPWAEQQLNDDPVWAENFRQLVAVRELLAAAEMPGPLGEEDAAAAAAWNVVGEYRSDSSPGSSTLAWRVEAA